MLYTVAYNAYAGERVRNVKARNVGRVVNDMLRKAQPGESVSVVVEYDPASKDTRFHHPKV
jgi:hypothetical protein